MTATSVSACGFTPVLTGASFAAFVLGSVLAGLSLQAVKERIRNVSKIRA
jgi:hypothetical protein